MYLIKLAVRSGKCGQGCSCVPVHLGQLTAKAIACPSPNIRVHFWPDIVSSEQTLCGLNATVNGESQKQRV